MSTEQVRVYVLDRIEGPMAVLLADDGQQEEVRIGELPSGASEGAVIRVPEDSTGDPIWTHAVIDLTEHESRVGDGEGVLRRLRKRDPGGDIVL
jgi:hypothetical protein